MDVPCNSPWDLRWKGLVGIKHGWQPEIPERRWHVNGEITYEWRISWQITCHSTGWCGKSGFNQDQLVNFLLGGRLMKGPRWWFITGSKKCGPFHPFWRISDSRRKVINDGKLFQHSSMVWLGENFPTEFLGETPRICWWIYKQGGLPGDKKYHRLSQSRDSVPFYPIPSLCLIGFEDL